MSNKVLISVIIPVYNVEMYLEECIESLVNQSIGFENIEVICIDDCSTDNSWNILCSYSEKYKNIKSIQMEVNHGSPGKPRNIGIDMATGKYIIFLDPDDIIPKDAYKVLYEYVERYKSDFAMGKLISFNDSDGRESEHATFKNYQLQKTYVNTNIEKSKFFLQVKTGHILKLVRRSLIVNNKIYFEENLKNGEDKLYDITVYKSAKKFTYIPICVYKYRVRDDENNKSMTQQDILSSVYNDINITKIIKDKLSYDEYKVFQVNSFRSVFWKMINEEFYDIEYEEKIKMLRELNIIAKEYDKELFKVYFNLENSIISLIEKGYYDQAIKYVYSLISRRKYYAEYIELRGEYKKIIEIRKTTSWRVTKALRNLKSKRIRRKIV